MLPLISGQAAQVAHRLMLGGGGARPVFAGKMASARSTGINIQDDVVVSTSPLDLLLLLDQIVVVGRTFI